jgi:hypothetical protein
MPIPIKFGTKKRKIEQKPRKLNRRLRRLKVEVDNIINNLIQLGPNNQQI